MKEKTVMIRVTELTRDKAKLLAASRRKNESMGIVIDNLLDKALQEMDNGK